MDIPGRLIRYRAVVENVMDALTTQTFYQMIQKLCFFKVIMKVGSNDAVINTDDVC